MKYIKGILSITMLFIGSSLFCQDISITSKGACFDTYTGSIEVDFDQYAIDYELPFLGSYYNLTNGDYEEISIHSNPLKINNLAAGEYEFQVFISQDEIMEFCWEIYEYKISDGVEIESYNAECYDDNGRIVVGLSSTLMSTGTPIVATIYDQSGEQITQKNIFVGLTQIKDLPGGNHTLKIELLNGCEAQIPFTILENQLEIPFEVVEMKKACLADGGIDINIQPLGGPYMIQWQNIDTEETYFSEDLENVVSGTYCLTIRKIGKSFSCEYTDTCLVVESDLEFRDKIVNHVCDSVATNGSILLNGADDNYTYKWDLDPPQTGEDLENLGPGKYCVVVTSGDGCEHHECFMIKVLADSIDISYDVIAACPISQKGGIILNVEPLTDNTKIIWDDIPYYIENIYTRNDLKAGDYMAIVSNECGTNHQYITIGYDCTCPDWQAEIPPYIIKDNCENGVADGYIFFDNAVGYSFLWPNGSMDYQMSGLSVGTYEVILTHDESQCQKTISFDIGEGSAAEIDYTVLKKACPSGGNGEIEVTISGSVTNFYWGDLGVGSKITNRVDLDAGTYEFLVNGACGWFTHLIEVPEFNYSIQANEFSGCDPFEEVAFVITGDNPPFEVTWETGDVGVLKNVEPGEYKYTITDNIGCEYIDEFEIVDPIEIISQVQPCPDVSNGSITFQINNPNNEFLTVTYDFGQCGECEDFPLIDPTTDSILVISLDNLPGGVPFTFEIDYGDCHFTKVFKLGEKQWEKEYVSSEEIDGIIYCTYDKVCEDIVIEGGFIEPAKINHFSSEDDEGWTLQGFGGCGDTDLVCGEDSVGVISEGPIKMRALEARAFYDKLGIVFNDLWELEIDKNPCRYAWVCPNGNVYPSFFSGNFFGGGDIDGYLILDNGCHEISCKYDFGLFSFHDNFVICDSFEFLPEWIEPYVNDSGEENEEKCDAPLQVNAVSIINLYKNDPFLFYGLEDSELLSFIEENLDNPAQNCANVTFCNDDFTILDTDIDEIDCDFDVLNPLLIVDDDGNSIYADPCETYRFDDDNIYALCPSNCGPESEDIIGCWYVNIVPFKSDPPGVVNPNGGSKIKSRNVAIQPQAESSSFYTFTQYVTEFGNLIYKPLVKTMKGQVRLNLLSEGSYETFPLDNIVFSHEDFRDGYHYTLTGKEGNYILSSGNFSNVVSKSLESSGYLKVLSNNFSNGNILISGEFVGPLVLNNKIILNRNLPVQFNLKLDINLNIVEFDYSQETAISVLHSNGKYLEIGALDKNSSLPIKMDGEIEIKQYYYDPISQKEYLIVNGTGVLTSNAVDISLTNRAAISLLCIQNDEFVWTSEIGEFSAIADNIPMTTDEYDNIYIGVSFKDQIEFQNVSIEESNQNSFDNIILKLNKGGELESYHLISNATDEIIEEVRIVNNTIAFGITSKGYEYAREVGDMTFFQFDELDSRGITSYILIDEMTLFSHNRGMQEVPEKLFTIVPNPATDIITIRSAIQGVKIMQVQIFDINGKILNVTNEIRSNSKIIDVSAMISGVYAVKVTTDNQEYSTQKLIITQ